MAANLALTGIDVNKIADQGFGDNSEWRLDIDIAAGGKSQHIDFDRDGVNSGNPYTMKDPSFHFNDGDFPNLIITATGREDDTPFVNDQLPPAKLANQDGNHTDLEYQGDKDPAFEHLSYKDQDFSMLAEKGEFSYTLHWHLDVGVA